MSVHHLQRPWLPIGLGALFTLVTTAITWAEHDTYNSTSLDMGAYTQLLWNTAHGRPFETTLLLQNRLHLAEHLALLLLPLAPLYGLLPEVKLLLLLQQVVLALSGAPLYWIARQRVGPALATLCLACYYAMPTLAEVALDAFYPIAFAALPVGGAVALAIAASPRAAALPSFLALLVEEEAALVAVGLGLFLMLFRTASRQAGVVLLLVAALWLGVGETIVMPRFQQPGIDAPDTRAAGHFSQLWASPVAWIGSVATTRLEPDFIRAVGWQPRGQTAVCPQPGQCSALRWWIYPTGGLALLSPATLTIAAPPAAALLLADRAGRFRRHWAAPMLPVIWSAAVVGLGRLTDKSRLRLAGAAALALASVLMYRLDSPLPLGNQFEAGDVVTTQLGADLRRLGSCIPHDASAAASRRGLAHLANRAELYVFPPKDYRAGLWPPAEPPVYLLLDLKNADTARELESSASPLRGSPPYHELTRTPDALLLGSMAQSLPSQAC
jgi:uncharacterized membrane protein